MTLFKNAKYAIVILCGALSCCSARPCKQCRTEARIEDLKEARISAIKEVILQRLGLQQAPVISPRNSSALAGRKRNSRFHRYPRKEEPSHELFPDDRQRAKTFFSISDTGAIPPYQDERTFHKKLGIYLPLDDQRFKKHQSVVSAKLKLFKLRVLRTKQDNYVTNGNFIRVNVYQLLEPARDDDRGTLERLVDSKPVGLVNGEWETFDIEPAVRTWLDSPQRNYGLVIRSESEDLSDYLQFALSNRTDSREIQHIVQENDLMPTLNILTQERVLSRNPRSVNGRDGTTCDEQDGHRLCCRYPLYVSFNEIGWSDWIIEPEGYDAFVCLGACPYKYKLANNHAGVVSSRHMINPMAAPQPCCRGTKLKPLNLLYVDREHGVEINTVIEDMIIEECRCA